MPPHSLARHVSSYSPIRHLSSSSSHSQLHSDSKQRALSAISLLKSETKPSSILNICRSASLSPDNFLHRKALSLAASSLSSSPRHLRSLLSPFLHSSHHLPHAISLFGLAGLLDDALAAFRFSPSLRSFNALLFASILSNKHYCAGEFFRDLTVLYRIEPNLVSYNTVIRAFCESGGARAFYFYLGEMVRRGIKPNVTTFSISLAGFYREERIGDVRRVLWLMRKHGRRAGLSVYNVRVQSLCKLGRPDEAKELLREMGVRRVRPNWATYDHLVLGFCCAGDLDEAKRMFEEMERRGLVAQSSCYFSLVYYLCRGGDFGSAVLVCRESLERNWVPRFATMKMLVDGLVSDLRIEEAKEIVEMVKGKFARKDELWKEIEESLPA